MTFVVEPPVGSILFCHRNLLVLRVHLVEKRRDLFIGVGLLAVVPRGIRHGDVDDVDVDDEIQNEGMVRFCAQGKSTLVCMFCRTMLTWATREQIVLISVDLVCTHLHFHHHTFH